MAAALSPARDAGRLSDVELCGLGLSDVDLVRKLADVIDKGSRPRVVLFDAETAQSVDRYLRVRLCIRLPARPAAQSARPDQALRSRTRAHPHKRANTCTLLTACRVMRFTSSGSQHGVADL
jgi:integrase